MSLAMLAVVALFPIALLAILLLTSGLEGRVVGPRKDVTQASLIRVEQEQRFDE